MHHRTRTIALLSVLVVLTSLLGMVRATDSQSLLSQMVSPGGAQYPSVPAVPCMDSDGENYYTAGFVSGTNVFQWDAANERSSAVQFVRDNCQGTRLNEACCAESCAGGATAMCNYFTTFDCPNGCENGACLRSTSSASSASSTATVACAQDGQTVFGSAQFGPTECCSKNAGIKPNVYLAGDQCVAKSDGSKGTCIGDWWMTCGNGKCDEKEDKCNCPRDCSSATCGNRKIDSGEECDPTAESFAPQCGQNGNCTRDCKCVHFSPPMPPLPPVTTECGNGVIDASEQCDPSAFNGTTACTSDQKCDRNCKCVAPLSSPYQSMPQQPAVTTECGNGVLDASEQCDPSAANGTAACTSDQKCAKNCKCVTPPSTSPVSPLQPMFPYPYPSAPSSAGSTTTGAPPAGFEDEVNTNPVDNQHNWFTDVGLEDAVGQSANFLADKGVIGGYSDGTFRADKPVNRAEAAKFLLLARYGSVGAQNGVSQFRDVIPGEWYVPYILKAAETGVIGGYPDGTFRPANTVNTAEFLKMLSIAFILPASASQTMSYTDVSPGDWFAPYAEAAFSLKLFPARGTLLEPSRLLTRGEVAVAIARILQQ